MGLGGRHELLAEEYWSWAAASLYLLLTVDLLTSLYASSAVGVDAEANPLMAWLLTQPLWLIVGAHLLATVLAALGFYWLRATLQRASAPVDRRARGLYPSPRPLTRDGSRVRHR